MPSFGAIVFCSVTLLALSAVRTEGGRMRCYNCTYVEYKKKITWGGLEECQGEKFVEGKVPVVTCDGKCVTRSVWGAVVVTQRTCHRDSDGPCDRIDRFNIGEDGYVSQVCCSGSRCNNAKNDDANSIKYNALILGITETIVLLIWFI